MDLFFQADQFTIHPRPGEAVLRELLHLLLELALTPADDRRHNHYPVFGSQRHYALDYLFRRLSRDSAPAPGAMRDTNRGEQQSKVVVDFCNCSNRGTRTAAGRLLLDRNRWAQPINRVHIRSLHLIKELACVGRKRLHVATLPFGVDRIESQGGLARAAQAGDYGQGVTRDLDVYVL